MNKKDPRSILELLEILKENFDPYFETGLCGLIFRVEQAKFIDKVEYAILMEYCMCNPPKQSKIFRVLTFSWNKVYWYRVGWKFPRKLWLNRQIKKLSRP